MDLSVRQIKELVKFAKSQQVRKLTIDGFAVEFDPQDPQTLIDQALAQAELSDPELMAQRTQEAKDRQQRHDELFNYQLRKPNKTPREE